MRKIFTAAAIAAGAAALLAAPGAPTLAQSLTPEQPAGADVESQEFQEWSLRCMEQEGERRCEMLQPVEDPETGEPVMAVVIPGTAGNQPLVAWIVLPLGVLLPPGIAISVVGSAPERIQILHCQPLHSLVSYLQA